MAFMDFRTKRLGMAFTVSGSPVAPSARFLVAVLFLARETSLNSPAAGFCLAPWWSRGSRSNINHFDEFGEAQLTVAPLATSLLAGHGDLLAKGCNDALALDD
jgi:hypothetical protein